MRKLNRYPRPFYQIRSIVLSELNEFLRPLSKLSLVFELQVNFSKAERTHNVTGVLDEQGSIGMLGASDFYHLDQVSSYLGAIVDFFCENDNNTPVTKMFTLYSDINFTLERNLSQPRCADKEPSRHAKMIREFKAAGTKLFEKSHTSGMRTQK